MVEVTNRTIHGRLLLRPSPAFNEIFLGVLGRTQADHQLDLHVFAVLSNHYHLLCSPRDPKQLADFMRAFNSKLAREVGRLHDWHDKVWGRRYQPIPVTAEPGAQIGRLIYVLSHGCKEGLVASPREWPGPSCIPALVDGQPLKGVWFNRTLEFKARARGLDFGFRDFATTETVVLSPLPCWRHLSAAEYRARIAVIVSEIEEESRRRERETGRAPVGRARVLRQNPHEMPQRSKRSPAPAVHAVSREGRMALIGSYREFLAAYRRASEKLNGGDYAAEFPARSFPPRLPYVPDEKDEGVPR
jgi:hypothetical protein